ncbi:MAG: hypothetical protein FJ320_12510 [SAR202 cluster bacterium]|nr:hypothetical protein [SAR202 cluster bacterium]
MSIRLWRSRPRSGNARAVCHKCGFDGAVPKEVRVGNGVGLYSNLPLDGPECVETDACLKRQQKRRWGEVFEEMEGKEAKCWVCHKTGIVGGGLTIAVDMLYIKKDEYGQVFEDVKWVHKDTQDCNS